MQIEALLLQSLMVVKHFKDTTIDRDSKALLHTQTGIKPKELETICRASSDKPLPQQSNRAHLPCVRGCTKP